MLVSAEKCVIANPDLRRRGAGDQILRKFGTTELLRSLFLVT